MGQVRRNTFLLKFKLPKTQSLIVLSGKITPCKKKFFIRRHGQILKLLTTNEDVGALVSLAQYYDPPLCCFNFLDFLLALTIEEFEILLGWYLKDHAPLTGLVEELTPEKVAGTLHLTVREVVPCLGPIGFSRKFVEENAQTLKKEEKWEALCVILSLIIYGVIMFPNEDEFIDPPTIIVFLAKNLVPTLLEASTTSPYKTWKEKNEQSYVVLHYFILDFCLTYLRKVLGWSF